MTNPYQSPSLRGAVEQRHLKEAPRKSASVGWLLLECLGAGFASTVASLFLAMALRFGVPEEMGPEFWQDTPELLLFLPWVMVLHNLLPSGWLFWTGCGLTVRTQQRAYLWLIAGCGVAVGILTPMMFYIDG